MAKNWKYQCGDDTVVVTYSMDKSELYVNDQLQDRVSGLFFTAKLNGKLDDGKDVRASVGGFFQAECDLFVDNKLQKPIK